MPGMRDLKFFAEAFGKALSEASAKAREEIDAEELRSFADLISTGFPSPSPRLLAASKEAPPPGLRHLSRAMDIARRQLPGPLFDATQRIIGHASWSSYYERGEWSEVFVDDLAVGQLAGPGGPWLSGEFTMGLFVQGSGTFYPPHAHPAVEVYYILGGNPEFQVGAGSRFVIRNPGHAILHRSNVSHAIRTGREPTLAAYAWRGDLTAPTWRRRDMSDTEEPKKYPKPARRTKL